MKINLAALKRQGKSQTDFEFEYIPKRELVLHEGTRLIPPVKVNGDLQILDGGVYVEAIIRYVLEGECSRCLKTVKNSYEAEIKEQFVETPDDDSYAYFQNNLDLTQAADDAIIMSQSINFLCSDECDGMEYKK